MQYEGTKLNLPDIHEIVDLDWFDDDYRLRKPGEGSPRYHDDCPVGWRTTAIWDIVRFFPELHGKELDEAWRKFRREDISLIDWMPSKYPDPDEPHKYMSFFPTFNFQQPGCYSCLAYNGDSPPEPSSEQPDVMDLVRARIDGNEEGCTMESKRSMVTPGPRNPRDPCDGVPQKPWPPRPPPKPQGHCCGMFDISPPPPPPVETPPPPPPPEPPRPPLEPGEDPCKQYENVCDPSIMSDEDWDNYELMGEHGYKYRPWVRMPPLNFLPTGVDRIIAGEKGYLVVDGGWQPRERIEGEYDLPMQDVWDLGMYPAQTITVVCNPMLKRFDYVAPFPNRRLNHKMARMEVRPDPETQHGGSIYNIYFVGFNHNPETNECGDPVLPDPEDMPVNDEVIVAIYNSNMNNWIATYSRPNVRYLPTNQTNDLALVNNKLYWTSEWADTGRRITVQNNEFKAPELKWIPVVSCFDFATREILGFAFCQDVYHKKVENLLLMECHKKLHLVTRATASNRRIPKGCFEVWIATHEEGSALLEWKKVGRMPKQQYDYLFNNCYMCFEHVCEPAYECRAGKNTICFYVPQCGTGVLFDVEKLTWISMERHSGWDLGRKTDNFPPDYSTNALASCVWEPDFTAMWSKEYRGPKWDPLGDDPTGPDLWPQPVKESGEIIK